MRGTYRGCGTFVSMQRSLRSWLVITLLAFTAHLFAQAGASFVENRGQWPAVVTHRAEIDGATVWLENAAILVDLYDRRAMASIAHAHIHPGEPVPDQVRHHAFRLRFAGANERPMVEHVGVKRGSYNYILGNDPSRWGRNCHGFAAVVQHDIYPGVDLRIRSGGTQVKYDLIIAPGADPNLIRFGYQGLDGLTVTPDALTLETTLGIVQETIPIAYQEVNGERRVVQCTYSKHKESIGFLLGEHDPTLPVVIDPTLNFSTYSGSFANNFGYTATFDRSGFLYSGSSAFGQGYPVTTGAFQVSHAGGDGLHSGIDMALSKYDTTGTFMVWSTYLGGSSDELPHSLIVNSNDELFVYGTTSSADFPVTSGAFDTQFHGGPPLNLSNGLGANFPNGTDIVVARLSADGTDLLAGTFIGGSANDGLNTAPGLKFNYADEIRGEVLLDPNDNVYIASSTASSDLPVTASAAQTTYGGGVQDGVLLKMDASLTTMIWCTYFGGSQADAVYNIELNDAGSIYIAGGTRSPDLPVSAGAYQASFQGGNADGFVTEISSDGSQVNACTYFGSAAYDQCYFADLDQNGDIYLFGQTQAPANAFIVNAPYNVPNAGQFITKLDPSLSTVLLSTRFGQGDGQPDISPTAFLVDYCNKIYISGWGSATGGALSTTGLPVTPDAYQPITDGNDFYLAVFDIDLADLYYATYFGGGSSAEHVDGGTSRFDRRGRIYQSVCAGCGGHSDFPIMPDPGAVSATNNSGFCNNAVFKFDMDFPIVVADFSSTVNCLPAPVIFTNSSYGAVSYEWSFGDNTSSTEPAPTHVYASPGVYNVRLVAFNPATCNAQDTTFRQVVVLGLGSYTLPDTTICIGQNLQIGLLPITAPGITYLWSPATGLSNAHVSNPFASPTVTTTYTLTISNALCSTTAEQTVHVGTTAIDAGVQQSVCGPNPTAQLVANGFGLIHTFQWSTTNAFTDTLNPTAEDSTATVLVMNDGWFFVRSTDNACSSMDSVYVDVSLADLRFLEAAICSGDTGTIQLVGAEAGSTFVWYPEEFITGGLGTAQINVAPPVTTTYFAEVTAPTGCTWSSATDQVVSALTASSIQATADPMIIVGSGSVQLEASPSALQYVWSPASVLNDPTANAPTAFISSTTRFTVTVSDGICSKDARVLVEVIELRCEEPDIFVPNTFTPNGDGQNDVLFVRGKNISTLNFLVFDRWGEVVFGTTDITKGWDGSYEGKPVDPAVFVYHLTVDCVDGQHYFTKGNITVVR